jgi:hypothetical protein
MNIRKIRLSVISVAALCPAMSFASTAGASFDACLNAFEKSITAPGAAIPAFKILYRPDRFAGSIAEFYATTYTYDLEARNPRSGATFARARCSADSRGSVLSMSQLPL